MSRTASFLLTAVLSCLLLFTYSSSSENGFHFDDYTNIVQHRPLHLEQLTLAGILQAGYESYLPWRPLSSMTFAFDWWRGKGSPEPFQESNRVLHLVTALIVGLLLLEVLGKVLPRREVFWLAPVGAALWALHPVQVQAVTYIVQRMALLAALFTVLSVWSYLRARKTAGIRAGGWLLLSILSLGAGLVSKENAAIIPILWILAEYGVVRHGQALLQRRMDWLFLTLPLLLVLAIAADLLMSGPFSDWLTEGYKSREFTLGQRLLTQPRVLAFHLGQIFWPLPGRFSLEHDFTLSLGLTDPPATVFALAGLLMWAGIGLLCVFSQKLRVAGFLLLWVPVSLVIESSLIPLEIIFEHRMYLASVGTVGLVMLGLGWLADSDRRIRPGAMVAGMAVIIVLAVITWQRLPVWRTAVTLGEHSARVAAASPRAWLNLGIAYQEDGQWSRADAALGRALQIDPENVAAYANRGALYSEDPVRLRDALNDFNKALHLDPDNITALIGRGTLYRRLGRNGLAIEDYQQVVRRYSLGQTGSGSEFYIGVAYYQLGLAYRHEGRNEDAAAAYKTAVRLRPGLSAAWFNLGVIQLERSEDMAAKESFTEAIRVGGEDADAYYYRALARRNSGNHAEAYADLSRALQLKPEDGEFWFQRGLLRNARGDKAGARQDFHQGCMLGIQKACNSGSPGTS